MQCGQSGTVMPTGLPEGDWPEGTGPLRVQRTEVWAGEDAAGSCHGCASWEGSDEVGPWSGWPRRGALWRE